MPPKTLPLEKIEESVRAQVRAGGETEEAAAQIGRTVARQIQRSRDRHARESAAKEAAKYNGALGGRDFLRKVWFLSRAGHGQEQDPELWKQIEAGNMSVNQAYAWLKGDTRARLFVRIPADLKRRVHEQAEGLGLTLAEFVTLALERTLP